VELVVVKKLSSSLDNYHASEGLDGVRAAKIPNKNFVERLRDFALFTTKF
jgi:hypothetical protein